MFEVKVSKDIILYHKRVKKKLSIISFYIFYAVAFDICIHLQKHGYRIKILSKVANKKNYIGEDRHDIYVIYLYNVKINVIH